MNFVVKTFDLSKERKNKNFMLEGNFYNSFVVTNLTGTVEMKLSRNGDWLELGTMVSKMAGVDGFNEIWLTNQAQPGKEVKIIFGQNLSNTDFDAFKQLSELGVDVNTTPGLKAGELNLDGEKDLQVDVKTSPDLKASELNLDVNDNVGTSLNAENIDLITKIDNMIGLLEDIKTNTSA